MIYWLQEGQCNCVSNLLERNQKKVVGLLVVVELSKLKKLKLDYPIESVENF